MVVKVPAVWGVRVTSFVCPGSITSSIFRVRMKKPCVTSSLCRRRVTVSPFLRVMLLGANANRLAVISITRADASALAGRELVRANIDSKASGKQIRYLDFKLFRIFTMFCLLKDLVLSKFVGRR